MLGREHKCVGLVVYEGRYEAEIREKKNNEGIVLMGEGIVRECKICYWKYAVSSEGRYVQVKRGQ